MIINQSATMINVKANTVVSSFRLLAFILMSTMLVDHRQSAVNGKVGKIKTGNSKGSGSGGYGGVGGRQGTGGSQFGRYRRPEVSPEYVPITGEQKLLYHLMRAYDPAVRPVRNASNAIVVRLGLTLINIFDMDEKNQVLVTNVWLDQEWTDELLTWDPDKFDGIQSFRVPCSAVWLPDIVLYNNADDYTRGYFPSRAMVHADGKVFWPPPTQLRSTCKIDVTFFPFDSQYCYLKIGSWTYNGFEVDVTNRSSNIDLSNYIVNGEFDLVSVHQIRREIKYACCIEPYPDVVYFFHIRRKILYYMLNVVFPCTMMSMLTLLVFCLPPDSGEKIALGITVLLAFSVFVLTIAEKMPETSDSVPLIGIYLTVVMGMTGISVVMTVMILNFHHRGPNKAEVPYWVRVIVLTNLRHLLCMRKPTIGGGSPEKGADRTAYDISIGEESPSMNAFSPSSSSIRRPPRSQFSIVKNKKSGSLRDRRHQRVSLKIKGDAIQQELMHDMGLDSPNYDEDYAGGRTSPTSMMTLNNERQSDGLMMAMDPAGSISDMNIVDSNHQHQRLIYSSPSPPTGGGRLGTADTTHLLLYPSQSHQIHQPNGQRPEDTVYFASPTKVHSKNSNIRRRKAIQTPKVALQDEVLKTLQLLISRQELEDECEEIASEWREVAQVIDRLLFWIFLVGTVTTTVTLLAIIPMVNKADESDSFEMSRYGLPDT